MVLPIKWMRFWTDWTGPEVLYFGLSCNWLCGLPPVGVVPELESIGIVQTCLLRARAHSLDIFMKIEMICFDKTKVNIICAHLNYLSFKID